MSQSSDHISSSWIPQARRKHRAGRHLVVDGNVGDRQLRDGQFRSVRVCCGEEFAKEGYDIIASWTPSDGILFATDSMAGPFAQARATTTQTSMADDAVPVVPAQTGRMPPPPQPEGTHSSRGGTGGYLRDPLEFATALYAAMTQTEHSCAVIVDHADLLLEAADQMGPMGIRVKSLLRAAMEDAAFAAEGQAAGLRNILVLIGDRPGQLSAEFCNGRAASSAAHIVIPQPSARERRYFVDRFWANFEGADQVDDDNRPEVVAELVRQTEGFTMLGLDALRRVGRDQKTPISDPKALLRAFRATGGDDPWMQLTMEKLSRADECLGRRVLCQPEAVRAASRGLRSAKLGLYCDRPDGGRGPRLALMFVGPTGVGKTELARAIADLVFSAEDRLVRLDMAEYSEPHSASKLVGAPPSYIGHEAGGQLTNAMLESRYRVVLFDEIEKAHEVVLSYLRGILDAGRLTDGQGNTVSFDDSVVILTSNIGSADLSVLSEGQAPPPYEEIRSHVLAAVEHHFRDVLRRPELFGRIDPDNVIVFDLLRREAVSDLASKFIGVLAENTKEKLGIDLSVEPSVLDALSTVMEEPGNRAYGGRRVRKLVESTIGDALSQWILENDPRAGTVLSLRMTGTPPVLEIAPCAGTV